MTLLRIEKNNGIATVFLNRPEKRNAMSFALLRELVCVANQIKKDRSIRCVILTGEADVFSAGIDLAGQSLFQKAFLIWQDLPVPVIAAIEGYCLGAGMQLALAADIRIAHPDTKMSIMESRWGLVPDMGLTRSIKGIISLDLAKELTLTGRIFDAKYAKEIGLVTHLDESPMHRAQLLAEEMQQRSPDALIAAKRVLDAMQHAPKKSLRLEKIWQLKLLLGKNSKLARQKDKKPEVQFLPRQYK